jgi:hypothetical protein
MDNREYYEDALKDFVRVVDNEKPVMIVSGGKSTLAYEAVAVLAEQARLDTHFVMLRCEDGEFHEHLIVSMSAGDIDRFMGAINDAKDGVITRPALQLKLGRLLGYSDTDIVEFIASATARECPCDCCGGPFVSEEITG